MHYQQNWLKSNIFFHCHWEGKVSWFTWPGRPGCLWFGRRAVAGGRGTHWYLCMRALKASPSLQLLVKFLIFTPLYLQHHTTLTIRSLWLCYTLSLLCTMGSGRILNSKISYWSNLSEGWVTLQEYKAECLATNDDPCICVPGYVSIQIIGIGIRCFILWHVKHLGDKCRQHLCR